MEYAYSIVDKVGLLKSVEFLTGPFFQHVNSTDLVIGGISSAIAEAMLHDIPYLIFEPLDNGYSSKVLRESSLLDDNRVARSSDELLQLILEGRPSILINKVSYLWSSGESLEVQKRYEK